jgi:hypothetical protein
MNPFEIQVLKLRVPIKQGELEVSELHIKPPLVKDILRTDGKAPEGVGYVLALISSLTDVPEKALEKLVPEDYADIRVIASQVNARFIGYVNLFDREDEEDPTKAANTPPPISDQTCGA